MAVEQVGVQHQVGRIHAERGSNVKSPGTHTHALQYWELLHAEIVHVCHSQDCNTMPNVMFSFHD
jgi:hypothetical protein